MPTEDAPLPDALPSPEPAVPAVDAPAVDAPRVDTPPASAEPDAQSAAPARRNADPLHGVTLETVLTALVEKYGWPGLAARIELRCFTNDPTMKSSLTFLRRTPWARTKVERLYIDMVSPRPPRGRGMLHRR